VILAIGGAASGKSAAALDLAGQAMPRAFLATGQPLDGEMAERIRRHQAARGPGWDTVEMPIDLASWFEATGSRYQTVVLDCLTLWLSNLKEAGFSDSAVPALVTELLQAMRMMHGRIVVVTNELGMGLVPMDADARRFRDLAGEVTQQFAREADEVYFVVAGLPVRIK
jgi:adenosylcobinamide kinase/adenosylcobinamide-phosphate guanylyltransferase